MSNSYWRTDGSSCTHLNLDSATFVSAASCRRKTLKNTVARCHRYFSQPPFSERGVFQYLCANCRSIDRWCASRNPKQESYKWPASEVASRRTSSSNQGDTLAILSLHASVRSPLALNHLFYRTVWGVEDDHFLVTHALKIVQDVIRCCLR